MKVVEDRCAFLDVHRDTVMACARGPDGAGGRREEVAEFGTTTRALLEVVDWLEERSVTLVAMEATGIYWKPVHWVLEDRIERVWVINARHMRNVPGRRTDGRGRSVGRPAVGAWAGASVVHPRPPDT